MKNEKWKMERKKGKEIKKRKSEKSISKLFLYLHQLKSVCSLCEVLLQQVMIGAILASLHYKDSSL